MSKCDKDDLERIATALEYLGELAYWFAMVGEDVTPSDGEVSTFGEGPPNPPPPPPKPPFGGEGN